MSTNVHKWQMLTNVNIYIKQAGAKLGQAQLKLELEWVLLDLRFVALGWLTNILMVNPTLSISSQNFVTSMPTYLHTK